MLKKTLSKTNSRRHESGFYNRPIRACSPFVAVSIAIYRDIEGNLFICINITEAKLYKQKKDGMIPPSIVHLAPYSRFAQHRNIAALLFFIHRPVRIPLFPQNIAGIPNLRADHQKRFPVLYRFQDPPLPDHKYTRMAYICIFAFCFLLSYYY